VRFRAAHPKLQRILIGNQLVTHPFLIGQLACGSLPRRSQALKFLRLLPSVRLASNDEVLDLIEHRPLWGKRIGWTDAHLLASALLTGCRVWTRDIRLQTAAVQMRLAEIEYLPPVMRGIFSTAP
jgi:predicted nucleic acid-binding protein